jgi:carbonic anhydrase/acetyltransferase-like protein (isoleucine patch superfamily)
MGERSTATGEPRSRELNGRVRHIAPTAVALLGAVRVGPRAGIWYQAVLRAGLDAIGIGEESNVQDGVVLHAHPGLPVRLGARVTVGHNATLHGCHHMEDDVLVGMGAALLDGGRAGSGSILAAGTAVPRNRRIPARPVVAGPTAAVVRTATRADLGLVTPHAQGYLGPVGPHRLPGNTPGPAGGGR